MPKVVMPAVSMAMNQTCYALRGRNGIDQLFVFLNIQDQVVKLKQRAHGAVFDTIITDTFRRLRIVKPPLSLIKEFHKVIQPLFDQMLNLLQTIQLLRQTRDLLLPRLVSGEIDVSEVKVGG